MPRRPAARVHAKAPSRDARFGGDSPRSPGSRCFVPPDPSLSSLPRPSYRSHGTSSIGSEAALRRRIPPSAAQRPPGLLMIPIVSFLVPGFRVSRQSGMQYFVASSPRFAAATGLGRHWIFIFLDVANVCDEVAATAIPQDDPAWEHPPASARNEDFGGGSPRSHG